MDAAALSLRIDSSSVVKATADLDRFAASSTKAAASTSPATGSIAKLVSMVQSMNSKLDMAIGTQNKASAALNTMAKAAQGAAAANDNMGKALAVADSHVIAYTQHLAKLAAGQRDANAHVVAWQNALRGQASVQGDANAHVLAYRDSLNKVAEGAGAATNAIKFTAREGLNASRQLADIGVTAAMGMSPFLIAIQQGPQLFDILQEKALATGTSIGVVFRSAAASVLAMAAPLLPLIGLLAVGAAGIAALSKQANDDSGLKKYTTAMGYTKEEVKKLNAVTVTWGDTTKAVFQTALASAAGALGINTKDMAKTWDSFLDHLATGTRATLAGIYAGIAGTKAYLGELEKGGVVGIGKMLIGQGDPDLLAKTYGKAYADGQKGLDAIVAQARKNALGRQNEMAKGFYDKPNVPKGPKPFTYDDLLKDAEKVRNDLNTSAAQIGVYGEALARVTYEQDLLNKASERGLKLSPAQRSAISGIAAELAKLSEANRLAAFREDQKQGHAQQMQALADQAAQIGLQGEALAALRYEQEQLNAARAKNLPITDADRDLARQRGVDRAAKEYGNLRKQSAVDNSRWHNEQMRQLNAEQGALGLTGKALVSYNYQQELINKSLAAGIAFKDLDIEKIRRQGDAFAAQRVAIDQQSKAIEDARQVTQGFFSDWVNGVRQGESVFKSFERSVLKALNNIIDKMMTDVLQNAFGGGGLFANLFGKIGLGGGAAAAAGASPRFGAGAQGNPSGILSLFANGGAFDQAQRFAKGGAFTNQIVNTPTLFRFAKGAALGEMGENGPEAVMPLSRGPDGKLGVQARGGSGGRAGDVHIENTFQFAGAVGLEGMMQLVRQGGEATMSQVRRELQTMLEQLNNDGTLN